MRRAINEYHMLSPGDKVAVGVSGGKDSMALLCAMWRLKSFLEIPFTLVALTVDPQFLGAAAQLSSIAQFCQQRAIPFYPIQTDIGSVVFELRREENPCSLCSRMRRGALTGMAQQLGCNKLALGHHQDDALETFVMNLLLEGRLYCFSPVTDYREPDTGIRPQSAQAQQRRPIQVIRPMIFAREWEIQKAALELQLPTVDLGCPNDGLSSRQWAKEWLSQQQQQIPNIRQHIFGAMRRNHLCGW